MVEQAQKPDLKKEGTKVVAAVIDGDKKLYLDEPTGEMVSKK